MKYMDGVKAIIKGMEADMVTDLRKDLGEKTSAADIAQDYMTAFADRIIDELEEYTKAYKDFEKKGGDSGQ